MNIIGKIQIPENNALQNEVWKVIQSLAERLGRDDWVLVGGQMALLYSLWGDVTYSRVTTDVDILANVTISTDSYYKCSQALRQLGFESRPDSAGKIYRYEKVNDSGKLVVDLLTPDHLVKNVDAKIMAGNSFSIEGGSQVLGRKSAFEVCDSANNEFLVPVPNLYSAIILKAAAWKSDNRDRDRHAQDVAMLSTLIEDPEEFIALKAGSDVKRLKSIDKVLKEKSARPWLNLDERSREIGFQNWNELMRGFGIR